jgi:hypothetical protein
MATIDLGEKREVNVVDVREDIAGGQHVTGFVLSALDEGETRLLTNGTTGGYRRLARVDRVPVRRLQFEVTMRASRPVESPPTLRLYGPA